MSTFRPAKGKKQGIENKAEKKSVENKPAANKSVLNKSAQNKPAQNKSEDMTGKKISSANASGCPQKRKCGGCVYQGVSYEKQLKKKQKAMEELLGEFQRVRPIIGMEDPLHYRNKVHHAFAKDRSGNILSGPYEAHSHWVLPVDDCMIEDEQCQKIIASIRKLMKSFHLKVYDEDTGYGLIRHVLMRRGFTTGEIMVVLVVGSTSFPTKRAFARQLRELHPEITTIVSNLNNKKTSMILGDKEEVLYGPGYIYDELMGLKFRISSKSFYQVNPVQTEVLYRTAIDYAQLTGTETVIDAYCGIGTIGLSSASEAGKVIGVELNPRAVADAKINARENHIDNAAFYQGDAGVFMNKMAASGQKADVVFMDPPRSGSTTKFMDAVIRMKPSRVIYVSCGPETLARDLKYMTGNGYICERIQPVDMFPYTGHVETVVLMSKKNS